MLPVPAPLADKDLAAYTQHLEAVRDALAPLVPILTEKEQKSMSSRSMGREGVPFAQQAGQVLANYKQVLNRRITDEAIAAYPQWLETFDQASELLVLVQGLSASLTKIALVAGVSVMDMARETYDDVKKDKGRTPGLHDLEQKLAERFASNGPRKNGDTVES